MSEDTVGGEEKKRPAERIRKEALLQMLREKGKRAYSHEVIAMAQELLDWRAGKKENDLPFPQPLNRPNKLTPSQQSALRDALNHIHRNVPYSETIQGEMFWAAVYNEGTRK